MCVGSVSIWREVLGRKKVASHRNVFTAEVEPRVFSACALRGPEEDHTTRNKQRMIYFGILYSLLIFVLLFFCSFAPFIKKYIKNLYIKPQGMILNVRSPVNFQGRPMT